MEQIIIYHPDGTAIPLISKKNVSVVSKATQKTALLSDDVISITVSSAVPLDLRIGDTARIYGKPYKLNQLPEPTKNGERRYSYELRLEGLQYDLIDVHYHLPEDAYGETFYADLEGHLKVLLWNINRIYPGKWVLGEFPKDTDYKNITNSEKNALQVLQELCSDYNVEFDITTDGTTHTLNIKAQVGVTHAFTLRFGRGKGLYQLSRKNVNNAGITNRLYVYGGTENLGNNYGHTKLCLPGTTRLSSYLEDKESISVYGVKEGEKNYSDIKPQRIGSVTALGKDVITFVDETMFDLNQKDTDGKSTKYLIAGTNAKIKFETGQLAGYEFDLHSYDHATHTFVINKFTDENGMVFPSEETAAFQIQKGDKYSIFDINLPDEYRTKAEKELAEEATKYLPTVSQPQVSYKLSLTEGFFTQLWGKDTETTILHVGDFIKIEDEQIGVSKAVRITEIDRDLTKRHSYDITLSDTVTKSTTIKVLNNLQEINETIAINKLADPTKARRKWRATQELLSMVFDPEGDYYSEKIKPLSIDTQMLSVGAKSTQFTLLNVTFQPNYNGNANSLLVSPGRLAHYAIDPDGVKYWLLDGATFSSLDTDTAYYIYARCSTTDTSGVITLSTTAKAVSSDAGYYNFLIGVLNSVVTDAEGKNPGRLVSLTYGSSTINGRFIRTGRIESSSGKCYFDLDKNEIGGNINIKSGSSGYNNLTDKPDLSTYTTQSELNVLDGKIEAQVKKMDDLNTKINTAGWITTEKGNKLYASKLLENGDTLISYINQSAGETTIQANKINLKGAVTFTSLNSSLQDTINNKVSSSSLGTLAYKDSVEAAQLGETIIVGGYLNTEHIKVNKIDADGAKIGGFTIEKGRLYWKAYDYFGNDSRALKLGVAGSSDGAANDGSRDGVVDVKFNAALTGAFGIKSVGRTPGGAAIYASNQNTPSYPDGVTTWAGYFDGSLFSTAFFTKSVNGNVKGGISGGIRIDNSDTWLIFVNGLCVGFSHARDYNANADS